MVTKHSPNSGGFGFLIRPFLSCSSRHGCVRRSCLCAAAWTGATVWRFSYPSHGSCFSPKGSRPSVTTFGASLRPTPPFHQILEHPVASCELSCGRKHGAAGSRGSPGIGCLASLAGRILFLWRRDTWQSLKVHWDWRWYAVGEDASEVCGQWHPPGKLRH